MIINEYQKSVPIMHIPLAIVYVAFVFIIRSFALATY